jgi:hypothetical protein
MSSGHIHRITLRVILVVEGLERTTANTLCVSRGFLFPSAPSSKLETCGHKKTATDFRQGGSSFVGAAGFEPAISCSQSRRLNRAGPRPDCLKRTQIYDLSFYHKVFLV